MRAITAVASALALFLLVACKHREIDEPIRARIASCGGGLVVERSLALQLSSDLDRGGLSGSTKSSLQAAVFSQVPASDRRAVYDRYVRCLTSEQAKEELLAGILQRRDEFIEMLRETDLFQEDEISNLAGYYQREHDAFAAGKLLESRRLRSELVMAFVQVAHAKGMSPFDYSAPPAPVVPLGPVPVLIAPAREEDDETARPAEDASAESPMPMPSAPAYAFPPPPPPPAPERDSGEFDLLTMCERAADADACEAALRLLVAGNEQPNSSGRR